MEVTLAINKMCGSACVRVGVSEEEWLWETLKPLEKKYIYIRAKSKRRRWWGGGGVRLCVCFQVTEQIKTTTKMYICQSWETSDAKCQRARWNTDKFPPYFFSPIYLNRCCGFLFYYTRTAERDQKKIIHFSSNQTKWEKKNGVCKLGILVLLH